MHEFIPSRTVREYAEKIGYRFSDMDIAAILYHTLHWKKRLPALQSRWSEEMTREGRIRTRSRGEDFHDASITVEFLTEDKEFSHDYLPPILLERAELSESGPKKPLLEAAGHPLRGAEALDELFRARRNYLAAVEKGQKIC